MASRGEAIQEAGREVNGYRGIDRGTIVWMTLGGYDVNEDPVFLFSHPTPSQSYGLPPHDHRDNANGGFAFSVFHPGTGIPAMPWSV